MEIERSFGGERIHFTRKNSECDDNDDIRIESCYVVDEFLIAEFLRLKQFQMMLRRPTLDCTLPHCQAAPGGLVGDCHHRNDVMAARKKRIAAGDGELWSSHENNLHRVWGLGAGGWRFEI